MNHSTITYRILLEAINKLDESELDNSVAVLTPEGEVYGVQDLCLDDAEGVLDVNHLLIVLNA